MRLANKEKVIILNWFINSLNTIHNHWWWWIIYKLLGSFVSKEFCVYLCQCFELLH
jgi:hypothetical protein